MTDIAIKSYMAPDSTVNGKCTEAAKMLEVSCNFAGARRAGIFSTSGDGACFDVGYRMSAQLGLVLMPQLDLQAGFPLLQNVVLGLTTYQCVVLQLAGLTINGRILVVLFEAGSLVTSQAVGRLEGVMHAWWHRAGWTSSAANLLHVCSACQDIKMADGGWAGWETILRRNLGLEMSHTFCPSCFDELYGGLSPVKESGRSF
jgi:hypothetical protein